MATPQASHRAAPEVSFLPQFVQNVMDRHLPFKVLESEPIGLSQTRGRSLNQIHELANQSPRKILPPRVECRAMPDNLLWNFFLSPLQPELSTERLLLAETHERSRLFQRKLSGKFIGCDRLQSFEITQQITPFAIRLP